MIGEEAQKGMEISAGRGLLRSRRLSVAVICVWFQVFRTRSQ